MIGFIFFLYPSSPLIPNLFFLGLGMATVGLAWSEGTHSLFCPSEVSISSKRGSLGVLWKVEGTLLSSG